MTETLSEAVVKRVKDWALLASNFCTGPDREAMERLARDVLALLAENERLKEALEMEQKMHQWTGSLQRQAEARVAELKEWKEAVIDTLVVNWGYLKEHEDEPRKAVHDLIILENIYALDPRVSRDANDLFVAGYKAGAEAGTFDEDAARNAGIEYASQKDDERREDSDA